MPEPAKLVGFFSRAVIMQIEIGLDRLALVPSVLEGVHQVEPREPAKAKHDHPERRFLLLLGPVANRAALLEMNNFGLDQLVGRSRAGLLEGFSLEKRLGHAGTSWLK